MAVNEYEINSFQPVAGSYALLMCEGKYLLCYNTMRKQWELPAGKRELNETPKECAIRELFEETGQYVPDLVFKGLMKVHDTSCSTLKYNPIYFARIRELQPFLENNETAMIRLWDTDSELGSIDEVDRKLIKYFIENSIV
jgi:8-oxo-dGTP diphosphatase